MSVGIVILNYNDSSTTIKLLNKIKEYKILDIIVVVDNNSTDNSYEILKAFENNKIKVLNSNDNKGYGYGNNIGCKYLSNLNIDYTIVSNPDIILEENDIRCLIENFKDDSIAIVAPVIKEQDTLNRGWKFQNAYIDALSNINYIGRYFKNKRFYNKKYYEEKVSKVDIVSGCFFIIRTSVFEQIGFFDENTFLYYEENIIAKKIQNIKMNIIVDNNVQIIHKHSISINKSYNKINKFKILAKSQRYYHIKYNNANRLQILVLDISYIVTIIISHCIKFIKDIVDFLKYLVGKNYKE